MYEESLTRDTKRVLNSLGKSGLLGDFYLAGGTALALYYGHRFSVDLDWFAESFSYTPDFKSKLSNLGRLEIDRESDKTFNGALNRVKISFFEYPYKLISSKVHLRDDIYLAGKPDIAAMKMEAIARRGTYKDFVDLYFLLKEYNIEQLLGFVREKFVGLDYNENHLLKSLTYFEDAKKSEFPMMIKDISWKEVKKFLEKTVKDTFKL